MIDAERRLSAKTIKARHLTRRSGADDGISLDPPEDRRVIHRHPAIQEHQLKVAIADEKHQIPPHRPQEHLGGKLPPLERLTSNHRRPT
jgi:hypothetical protein